jgi:hypothetical protein
MPIAIFESPDGDDIEVDSDEVVAIRPGEEEGTVTIELDDGSELTVVATELEAVADLGLDPLEFVTSEDHDEDDVED